MTLVTADPMISRHDWENALIDAAADKRISGAACNAGLRMARAMVWGKAEKHKHKPGTLPLSNGIAARIMGVSETTFDTNVGILRRAGFLTKEAVTIKGVRRSNFRATPPPYISDLGVAYREAMSGIATTQDSGVVGTDDDDDTTQDSGVVGTDDDDTTTQDFGVAIESDTQDSGVVDACEGRTTQDFGVTTTPDSGVHIRNYIQASTTRASVEDGDSTDPDGSDAATDLDAEIEAFCAEDDHDGTDPDGSESATVNVASEYRLTGNGEGYGFLKRKAAEVKAEQEASGEYIPSWRRH